MAVDLKTMQEDLDKIVDGSGYTATVDAYYLSNGKHVIEIELTPEDAVLASLYNEDLAHAFETQYVLDEYDIEVNLETNNSGVEIIKIVLTQV